MNTETNIHDGEEVERNKSDKFGMKYYSLAYKKTNRSLEPFMIEYRPAKHKRKMKANDVLYLSKNIPHCVHLADGCKFAQAITVYEKK